MSQNDWSFHTSSTGLSYCKYLLSCQYPLQEGTILTFFPSRLTAVVGGIFYKINPNKHPFSLQDPNISFPNKPDTVTTATLLLVSLVAPAAIIALVCLFFVPGPTAEKGTPKSLIWRRKIWEMNTGGMGLGIALAGAFLVTEGMKDLYGKPRPDFLALCNPDLTNIPAHTVGGLGGKLDEAPIIVAWTICKNTGSDVLQEGFASFPSGHSSCKFYLCQHDF